LAPNGWHVPNDREWWKLIDYLGGETNAGFSMKSTNDWGGDGSYNVYNSFCGLSGGLRTLGDYNDSGGYWWSSSEFDKYRAWSRLLIYNNNNVLRYFSEKESGFSIRCIKD
jgi:uncharacterized protein (TIGR02145 family)